HQFTYPLFSLRVRLNELSELGKAGGFLFSYNAWGVFSLRDSDLLSRWEGGLEEKLATLLEEQGIKEVPAYVDVVTHPRLFGYVFNPVSFFLCFQETGDLMALVAEVHNTFGERHVY